MDLLLQILTITLPVFSVAAVGYVYALRVDARMEDTNRLNVNLFTPALLFHVLSEKIPPDLPWGSVTLGMVGLTLGSALLAWAAAVLLGTNPRHFVPVVTFRNTGNLGLPLAALAFGEHNLPLAVVAFVSGTLLHFTFGIQMLSGRWSGSMVWGHPVFLATGLGILFLLMDWHVPGVLLPGLELLADVTIPLMLVSLGARLTTVNLRHWRLGLAGALLAPLLGVASMLLVTQLAGIDGPARQVLLLYGALPPAAISYLLAEQYRTDPDLAASIIALGHLVALGTIPVILAVILG
ncbi:MAG: AEC family transporter [Magnetococcus sp. WYHC-3]